MGSWTRGGWSQIEAGWEPAEVAGKAQLGAVGGGKEPAAGGRWEESGGRKGIRGKPAGVTAAVIGGGRRPGVIGREEGAKRGVLAGYARQRMGPRAFGLVKVAGGGAGVGVAY
jgi:hypothetical protein